MGKHLFIAGHGKMRNGKFDPGATGIISKGEHRYMVENLFPAIRRHLPKGHNIVFHTSHNVVSYGDLVSLARKHGANQVTEFHYDAASASARGGHVIIHGSFKPDKTDLALRDAIKSMVGVRYNHKGYTGISGRTNLGNCNRAKNAGITYRLLELGFGTNKTDADIMVNQVDEYAKAIIKAVGVKPSTPSKTPSKPKPSKPKSNWTKVTGNWTGQTLRNGEYGEPVKQMQTKLANNNPPFYPNKGAKNNGIDSYFGDNTEDAVRRFQSYYGLTVDGLPGKQVYNKLGESSSSGSKKTTKSVNQMATEVIQGKHGSGHEARRKSLGISKSKYEQVRKEVNKRL